MASRRSRTSSGDGGVNRGSRRMALSGLMSQASGTRPARAASSGVVPRPAKGSYTSAPGAVSRSMKNRGSCGLKQARYEISWRLCAARCRLVQNSLTNVGTAATRPSASAAVVIVSTVARCWHRKPDTWRSNSSAVIGDHDTCRRSRQSRLARRSSSSESRAPPLDVARGGPELVEGPSPESRSVSRNRASQSRRARPQSPRRALRARP